MLENLRGVPSRILTRWQQIESKALAERVGLFFTGTSR